MPSKLVLNPLMTPMGAFRALRNAALSDTGVVVGVMAFQNAMRIVSSMILTRLLTAEAFAVSGIITSVMVAFALLSDIGLIAFMVRHKNAEDRVFRDQVWTLRVIRGIVLSILVAILSGPIAAYMREPELQQAIATSGLMFLFDSLGSLAPLSALRKRRVRMLSAIDVLSQIVGMSVSIALALYFRSYWSMIFSTLFGQIMGTAFSYLLYPDSGQRVRFSRERAAELWQFSRLITSSTILTLIITQGDKLILSRAFSLETMGFYVIAAGLAAAPAGLVSSYAGRVLYPIYAEIFREAPETLRQRYYSVRMTPTLLYSFAAGGLIGCAPAVIALLYDPRYLPAGAYLQILLISSFFAASNSAANDVMITLGRTQFTLVTNIVRLFYLSIGAWIGYIYLGPLGVVWAVGTVELAAQIYAWIELRRLGFLQVSREALILLVGAAGMTVGYGVDLFSRLALHLH